MVIDLAYVFSIVLLQKDTSFLVGVNHIDLPCGFRFLDHGCQGFIPQLRKGSAYADMTAHLSYEIHLIGI